MPSRLFGKPAVRRIAINLTVCSGALSLLPTSRAQVGAQVKSEIDESRLVTLAGNTHPLAQRRYDLGPASTSGRMLVVLKRTAQQEEALQQLLREQKDPTSPNFHKWLSAEDFGQRFGIGDSDLAAVTDYLQQKGLTINSVSKGRMSIEAVGSSEQVSEAFHTHIHSYAVGANQFFANDQDPQIPQALSPVVAGLAALNNYRPSAPSTVKRATLDPATHTLQPLYTTTTTNGTTYGVSPGDLAVIYNIPAQVKPTGTAPAIGVISDSNVNLNNIAAYNKLFGLSSSLPSVIIDGNDPGTTSDALTTTEELELISAVAPYATTNLYTSATTDYDTGFDFAAIRAVTDDAVNILDFGFLTCESSLGAAASQFVSALWEQAAAEGITVVSATGDAGSTACDLPGGSEGQETSVNGPAINGWASTPYNTAVGGTDFYYTNNAPPGNYWSATNTGTAGFTSAKAVIPQQVWNDSNETTDQSIETPAPLDAGGGGASSLGSNGTSGYDVPSWQTSMLKGQATTRAVPDLSLFAGDGLNGSYYLLCFASTDCASGKTSTFTTAGGTAAASSVFAGIIAQIVQQDAAQGNINQELYTLAAASSSTSFSSTTAAFYDVTAGTNSVACSANCTGAPATTINGVSYVGYPAATGYDLASGLGTVNAKNLISRWANIHTETTPGSVSMSLYSAYPGSPLSSGAIITHGATTYLGVSVAAASGKPTPTGDVAFLTSNIQASNRSIDRVTLANGSAVDMGSQLPGGTYTLQAAYAGDTNYAPATSLPFTITVNPEPSQVVIMSASAASIAYNGYLPNLGFTLLGTSPATIGYGTQVRITAEPFGLGNNSVGIPSGFLTVFDNGIALTKIPLNSEGSATFESSSLSVGSHAFTFSYAGDASFLASTSLLSSIVGTNPGATIYNSFTKTAQTPVSIQVTKASTQIALSSNGTDLTALGGTATLTAVVSSTSPVATGSAPTGQVQFTFVNANGGVSTSLVAVTPSYDSNGNLVATATESATAVGTYTATFIASGNYVSSAASNPIALTQSFCTIICTTTNTTTSITTAEGGTSYTASSNIVFNIQVKATYYLAGIIPIPVTTTNLTGSVTVYANGLQIGQTVALDPATGSATFTVPKTGNFLDVPSGSVVFTASYTGGVALPGNFFQFTAEPSTGSDTLTITGNASGNPTTPALSGDFSLQSTQTAAVMPAGTTGSLAFPLQLTATNSFAQNYKTSTIALTCASSTPGLTCALSSGAISLGTGYGAATATIKVASTYTVAADTHSPLSFGWKTGSGVAMGCILLLGLPARRRKWQAMLSAMLLCMIGIGGIGCGSGRTNSVAAVTQAQETRSPGNAPPAALPGTGGATSGVGSGSGTPFAFTPAATTTLVAGTYPVTITGTVTLNGVTITHNTAFNVVVQ